MSVADAIPDELKALHRYYLRASSIREDMLALARAENLSHDQLERLRQLLGEDAPDAVKAALKVMDFDMRMSVFYGLVYVICEGFRELRLSDPKLDILFADPLFEKLRRYRNAIFHFQKEWFAGEKHMDFFVDLGSPAYMRQLWSELNRWFSNALVRPVLTENGMLK